ncbi:hypothetical protein [Pseudophaeobacter sp.]|uniref:hypothetical protein n=1 Tax=Pseudophaeobacter sp. TaxID=1971739 RepID=UPI004058DB1F
MTRLGWQAWTDHDPSFDDPYVEWFHDLHGDRRGPKPTFIRQVVPQGFDGFTALDPATEGTEPAHVFLAPDYMTNERFSDWWDNQESQTNWLPAPEDFDYPQIGSDEIVAGIIDVGLAFGHRRFRRADGTTRVLGAWQQGAAVKREASGAPEVAHLPFGAQLFQSQIDRSLADFSLDGDLGKALDQDGFNRANGLVDFTTAAADRALAQRGAHGTHVMGLVAGADPFDAIEKKFSKKVRVLVVSLPPSFAYGEGGAFLDYYLIYALRWIREVNTRIAEASGLGRPRPLVTNISFGKHAGAGDAAQPFVRALIKHAQSDNLSGPEGGMGGQPLHVVLPAGNSNLDRAQAAFELQGGEGEDTHLDWVVQPEDATSNFLEIWCKGVAPPADGKAPLEIELVPPGQTSKGTGVGQSGQISRLVSQAPGCGRAPLGRIYCERFDLPAAQAGAPTRADYRYLICLAADRYQGDKWAAAPAGRWQLRLRNRGAAALAVKAMVQTDQSTLVGQANARRSYLDDPTYRRFDNSGRLQDSYAYGYRQGFATDQKAEDLDTATYVKRRGSLNSYADNSAVATIAGYRANDGRPADYSSSGTGKATGAFGRATPTVALPTDDGYAHPGVLSDGSSDGSVVAMRGTSFASAMAVRDVLEAWLDREHDPYGATTIKSFLRTKAQRQRPPQAWFTAPVKQEKLGAGRIVFAHARKIPRL